MSGNHRYPTRAKGTPSTLQLVACNVLHREWADEYDSDFKLTLDEPLRMKFIADKVVDWMLHSNNTVVALSELSGDQLDAIAVEYCKRTGKNLIYESSVYTEEIKPDPAKATYQFKNIKESTTLLIRTESSHKLYGKGTWEEASGNDGKGWVAIGIGRVLVISVHISYNAEQRKKELEYLLWRVIKVALDNEYKSVIIMGDFNASFNSVKHVIETSTAEYFRPLVDGTRLAKTFKSDFKVDNCFFGVETVTRKFSKSMYDQCIDHILLIGRGEFFDLKSDYLSVESNEANHYLTDHAFVKAVFSYKF